MPSTKTSLALAALAAALTLAACDVARPIAETGAAATACTGCHGDASRTDADPLVQAAPPASVRGGDGGAHLAHLRGGALRGPLACGECHVVPSRGGHSDGAVEVTFPGLGATGSTPRWDAAKGTCSGVYCHGATLSGGPATTPAWSSKAGLGCASCHGYPPPSHAPTSTDCGTCHPGTVKDGVLDVANGLHVNGRVDVQNQHPAGWRDPTQHGYAANRGGIAGCRKCHGADLSGGSTGVSCNSCHGGTTWQTSCTFCHGDRAANRASPPVDTQGRTAASNLSVGLHAAHVGTTIARPLACSECHPDRTGSNAATDTAHVDGDGIAEVSFGALARTGNAPATYTRTSATAASCSSVYCHGRFAGGAGSGAGVTMSWTSTEQATCTTCHGAPPPAPHTSSTSCGACHDGYTQTTVNAATHVDGVIQASGGHPAGWASKDQHGYTVNRSGLSSCKSCHGANLDGVGGTGPSCGTCHQSAGITSWQTSCTFCHGDRVSGRASPPVDTQGRSVATNVSVGVHAAHVGTTLTTPLACTECHPGRAGSNVVTDGAHIDGDGVAEISFGTLARSGGAPATYTRTSDTSATCASTYCHGRFTGGAGSGAGVTMSWTSTEQATCTSCHGAPPPAPHTSSTSCGGCHDGYTQTTVNAATHIDGLVEASGGHPAGWASKDQHGYTVNRTGLSSCKGCHGTSLDGVGGSGPSCGGCHQSAGIPSWQTSCTFCHGDRVSGRASPPVDTQGRSVTTNVSVGVHAAHVGTTLTTPLACTECHPSRAGSNVVTDAAHVDGDGTAEIAFGALARTGGAPATYSRASATSATCASTYCHGRFTGGAGSGAGATMSWTSTTQVSCTSCHGAPPSTGEHGVHSGYGCAECHGHSGSGATHVNGVKNVPFSSSAPGAVYSPASRSCGSFSCHGESHPSSRTW